MATKPEAPRLLRQEERDLILLLVSKAQGEQPSLPPTVLVSDIRDGAMGSIRLLGNHAGLFGRELISGRYQDSDGTLVSIALNTDEKGNLFELDFWKVDFSPLKRYPKPQEVQITEEL